MSFGQTKANPSPLLQSPVILQGGGTPGGTSGPPESEGGGNRGESRRHSHSLLTPVGSADMSVVAHDLCRTENEKNSKIIEKTKKYKNLKISKVRHVQLTFEFNARDAFLSSLLLISRPHWGQQAVRVPPAPPYLRIQGRM